MKKGLLLLIALALFSASVCWADDNAPAILESVDGKALRIFLMGMQDDVVSTEFQKLRQKKDFAKSEIQLLEFTHQKFNRTLVENAFVNADYAQVIQILQPVVAPYEIYLSVANNLQSVAGLLMQAYCRSGQYDSAARLAARLIKSDDAALKLDAQVCGAIAAARLGGMDAAEALYKQIENPAAALYVRASIDRTQGDLRAAMESVVEVIAAHINDLRWLASAEFLCAELYLEMGRTNSAVVTSRQTEKMYAGTNIGKEAGAFRSEIELSQADSE